MDKIYISNKKLDVIRKLRIKSEKYWALHSDEIRISYEGTYTKPNMGCALILINGLSRDDLSALRKIGYMPKDEFFDMHVKE